MSKHARGAAVAVSSDQVEAAASGILSEIEDLMVRGGISADMIARRLDDLGHYKVVLHEPDRGYLIVAAQRLRSIWELVCR